MMEKNVFFSILVLQHTKNITSRHWVHINMVVNTLCHLPQQHGNVDIEKRNFSNKITIYHYIVRE